MKVLIVPYVKNFSVVEKEMKDIQFTKSHFGNISFMFTPDGPKLMYKDTNLTEFNFVWLASWWGTRDLAYATSLYLSQKGIKHTDVESGGSKIVDHMIFNLNNIPSPNTFFINSKKIKNQIYKIEETCGYPLIIKSIKGSRGRNTFLIKNRDKLITQTKQFKPNIKYMYQQFIPNDYDWGVLVSNGKVVAAEKSYRQDKNEFRNHAFRGAKEIFTPLSECPTEVKSIAQQAAKALNLEWCRADIVIDKNTDKPYLLEVNRYPGITKGTDEAKAVKEYVRDLINEA